MAIKRTLLDVLLADGTEHIGVVITLKDQLKAEEIAARHKWGPLEACQTRVTSFMVWHSLRRTGRYAASYETFVDDVETIAEPDTAEVDEVVDPTSPAAPGD